MASREMTEIPIIMDSQDIANIINSDTTIFIAVDIENTETNEYSRQMRQIRRDDLLAFVASSLGSSMYCGLDFKEGQGKKMLDASIGPNIVNLSQEIKTMIGNLPEGKSNVVTYIGDILSESKKYTDNAVTKAIEENITAVLAAKY